MTATYTPKRWQIVLAWATKTQLVETAKIVRRNGLDVYEMETAWEGHAAMWDNDGNASDVQAAVQFAQSDTDKKIYVFSYPLDETDPLGKAKADALELNAKNNRK